MSITLDQVVPWGRSLEEYRRMFEQLREASFVVEIQRVPYELQAGSDQMMRISHA
jgi:hypothetical protein